MEYTELELNQNAVAGLKAQMDTEVKKILSQKIILAWIVHRTVREFAEMSLEDIMDCIEGTPQISSMAVTPGNGRENFNEQTRGEDSKTVQKGAPEITGNSNESSISGEGQVFYDIIFEIFFPKRDEYVKMIINIEAQKDYTPGYELVTRGIFYGARMISEQKNKEFVKSDYDNLKKVYSIWIGMNAPGYIGNAISEYRMRKEDLIPGIPDREAAYDKLSVIIIALNGESESGDNLTGMLNTLLSNKLTAEEKITRLRTEYHMKIVKEIEEGVNDMCNLSDLVEEKGIQKGIKQGVKQGVKQGKVEEREYILDLATSGDYTLDELIALLRTNPAASAPVPPLNA